MDVRVGVMNILLMCVWRVCVRFCWMETCARACLRKGWLKLGSGVLGGGCWICGGSLVSYAVRDVSSMMFCYRRRYVGSLSPRQVERV